MKLERLIAMVMLLLERSSIKANVLAEYFEVSQRTIYRDVESLSLAGLPIVTKPGPQGGISLMDTYKIKGKLFTPEEVAKLMTSLKAYDQLTKKQQTKNTLVKLTSLIEEGEMFENPIYLDLTANAKNTALLPLINLFQKGIAKHQLVSFDYYDQKGRYTHRQVESYRLAFKESKWYLQAFCLKRQDFRIFKLSRMREVKRESDNFIPRPFTTLDMNEREWMDDSFVMATLNVSPLMIDQLVSPYGTSHVIEEGKEGILIRCPVADNPYGYEHLLSFGLKCEILSPPSLRDHFQDYLKDILAIYS